MSTARSRLPATALSLVALVFTATTPVLAQTAWDTQDQADMLGRLTAQGLVRSMDSVRARADERDRAPAPARLREADYDHAAGVDSRRSFGHESGARTPPAAGATVLSGAEATTKAPLPPARERHAREL
jgi:hypothetical protein